MKITKKEMDLIGRNLKIGKCPICGGEEQKHVYENVVDMVSMDNNDDDEVYVVEAVMAQCVRCGYLFLFNKDFLMEK